MQETQEMPVASLGREGPLEEGMATHSSILAWEIPWAEEPGGLQSTGKESGTWLSMREHWALWWITNKCMKLCMDRMVCTEIAVKWTSMSISSRKRNRTLLHPEVPCEPDHISPSCCTALIEHYSKFCIKNTLQFFFIVFHHLWIYQ